MVLTSEWNWNHEFFTLPCICVIWSDHLDASFYFLGWIGIYFRLEFLSIMNWWMGVSLKHVSMKMWSCLSLKEH